MSIPAEDQPGMRIYYDGDSFYFIYLLIIFGLIAVAVTLYKLSNPHTTQKEKYLLLVAWAVIPPIWFVLEYFCLFLPYGVENSFKYFDYGQNVASKLWGAVSALIILVIYKDAEKEKKESQERQKDQNE
jgi:hypothetical protein